MRPRPACRAAACAPCPPERGLGSDTVAGGSAGIVAAGVAHAGALAAIHGAACPAAERWDAGAIAALLGTPGCFALLAEAGGMAILRVAGDEAEVLTLAVLPAVRARGIGGALLAAGLTEAALRGAATVLLEVAPDNVAARALYARAGFGEVGLRRGYYPDGGDALVMRHSQDASKAGLCPDPPKA